MFMIFQNKTKNELKMKNMKRILMNEALKGENI